MKTRTPNPHDQENSTFPAQPYAQTAARWNTDKNGMAIAGFVLSLAAWLFALAPPLAFILWVLAVVFSGIGLSRAMNEGRPHKGLAIAGLVLSLGAVAVASTYIVIAMMVLA